MALQKMLASSGEPYARRSPLVLKVVGTRESVRVTQWRFENDEAVAVTKKLNVLVAASDGQTTTKFVVFEEAADKVKAGQTYCLRNYRVGRAGGVPALQCWRDTAFYNTAPLAVSEELEEKCRLLLFPHSKLVDVSDVGDQEGLVTVCGQIASVS